LPYKADTVTGGIWWDEEAGAIRWEGMLAAGESHVFTYEVQGPSPIIPHDSTYVNEVVIEDGVHAPIVRSASVLANPQATPTPER
jgi:hypothetical protein